MGEMWGDMGQIWARCGVSSLDTSSACSTSVAQCARIDCRIRSAHRPRDDASAGKAPCASPSAFALRASCEATARG